MNISRTPSTLLLFLSLLSLCSAGLLESLSDALSFLPFSFDRAGFPAPIQCADSEVCPSSTPMPRVNNLVPHFNNVTVVDHMQPGLPKVRLGHRVVDLFNGWHFDDILMDAPDPIRPSGVVAFYDSSDYTCMRKYRNLNFDTIAETKLPPRSQLFAARYDMYSAPRRAWYEFTPEMDLQARFGVKSCPEVVFVSRKCDGFTEWCNRGKDEEDVNLDVLGCDDFKEHCTEDLREVWDGSGDLAEWINKKVAVDGRPKLSKFLGSYKDQGQWLRTRERTTCVTHFRNVYISQAFPAFTKRGFKVVDIPEEMLNWLLNFVEEHQAFRKTEYWNAGSTQMSFHEKPTTFIDMDRVRRQKEDMANKYLKPLLEEWSGMSPLQLTSFYGMREYHEGSWLREHVDRIDTHVLSITLSVAKRNFTFDQDGKHEYKPWPLQVTDWTGKQVAYDHPPGTMILYESSKLPHGRPTRNDGGIHLGCFVHFKPVDLHNGGAQWNSIADRARANQKQYTETAHYRSTKEVEPPEEEIEWAENIGDGTDWHANKSPSSGSEVKDDAVTVSFWNKSKKPLDVYWYRVTKADPVSQGEVPPGSFISINSYVGHTFFWAEKGSKQSLPGGEFKINAKNVAYEYGGRDEL